MQLLRLMLRSVVHCVAASMKTIAETILGFNLNTDYEIAMKQTDMLSFYEHFLSGAA